MTTERPVGRRQTRMPGDHPCLGLFGALAAVGALRKTAYKPQSGARPQQRTIVARGTKEIRPRRGR